MPEGAKEVSSVRALPTGLVGPEDVGFLGPDKKSGHHSGQAPCG
jgi:hypothetical protein